MIGNYKMWITARYESGVLLLRIHSSATYVDNQDRTASVAVDLEPPSSLESQFAAVMKANEEMMSQKVTVVAAESLAVAARNGEL